MDEAQKSAIGAIFTALTKNVFGDVIKTLTTVTLRGLCLAAKTIDATFKNMKDIHVPPMLPILGYPGDTNCEKVVYPAPLLKLWEGLHKE